MESTETLLHVYGRWGGQKGFADELPTLASLIKNPNKAIELGRQLGLHGSFDIIGDLAEAAACAESARARFDKSGAALEEIKGPAFMVIKDGPDVFGAVVVELRMTGHSTHEIWVVAERPIPQFDDFDLVGTVRQRDLPKTNKLTIGWGAISA